MYKAFCEEVGLQLGKPVQTGTFGADMKIELLNDGPVTIIIDHFLGEDGHIGKLIEITDPIGLDPRVYHLLGLL